MRKASEKIHGCTERGHAEMVGVAGEDAKVR